MTSFVSIPPLSPEQLTSPQMATIEAMRQNLELLIGDSAKGENSAVTRNTITVEPDYTRQLEAMSASGYGYKIQNVEVAALADVRSLIQDVQRLSNDVQVLYNLLNSLIVQIKG